MNQSTKAKLTTRLLGAGIGLASLLLAAGCLTACSGSEGETTLEANGVSGTLYVADSAKAHGTVVMFNAATGAEKGTFKDHAGLGAPMGLVPALGGIVVADLHPNNGVSGDVQVFSTSGSPLYTFLRSNDKNTVFTPRGVVVKNGIVYVADTTLAAKNDEPANGLVRAYKSDATTYCTMAGPADVENFLPRGIVIGPDGLLYVASVGSPLIVGAPPALGGNVFRFNPTTCAYLDTFIADAGGVGQLNRPDGIVFAPDGKLYIASFRANANDIDSIRIYNADGSYNSSIALDVVGQPRAVAQALLFGPGGDLFTPISGGGPDSGAVRRYNVTTKAYTNFVEPGGLLEGGWYLTFDKTNPATLAYEP